MTGQEENLWINVWIYPVSLLIDTKIGFRKQASKQASAAPGKRTRLPEIQETNPLTASFQPGQSKD